MKIANALRQLKMLRKDTFYPDEYNAITTARKSLEEWAELSEEAGREAIRSREDLHKLINRHIERIERK